MGFLSGTFHILAAYLGLFLVLCLPPYLERWKRLVIRLDQLQLPGERLARSFRLSFPPLLLTALIITHLFQYNKKLEIDFHLLFAPAAFIVIPFLSAYFGLASWIKGQKLIGCGRLAVLLFSYGGFAVAGTNLHDVLWCARATRLYTKFAPGGDDLIPWVWIFNPPSYDYRILGFYMLIQVLIGLALGHVTLIRLLKLEKQSGALSVLKWNWAGTAFLAFAISLIDWPDLLNPPLIHTSLIAGGILIASILFHQSGLVLCRLSDGSGRPGK